MATDLLQGCKELVFGQSEFLENAAFMHHGEQHMLHTEIVVFQRTLLVFRFREDLIEPRGEVKLPRAAASTLHLRQFAQGLFRRLADSRDRNPGLLAKGWNDAAFLFEKRQEQMLDIHALVTAAHGVRRCSL